MQPLLTGVPVRLAVLDYGLFKVHENGRVIGICGYVIQTDADETVLIDTGFPGKYADDAQAATREDGLGAFGRVVTLTHDNLAPSQLARLGLGPGDIDVMIQSHTHIDHVGFMHAFPDVPILIADAERALPHPLYWSGAPVMEWPDAEYHRVRADMTLGPGFDVLLVPGHAPGQLAFVLELPDTGPVVLTSDAISRPAEPDTGYAGAWNAALALHHADRLLRRAAEEDALVIYGHCPAQWPRLRKAPEWYS